MSPTDDPLVSAAELDRGLTGVVVTRVKAGLHDLLERGRPETFTINQSLYIRTKRT